VAKTRKPRIPDDANTGLLKVGLRGDLLISLPLGGCVSQRRTFILPAVS